MSRIDQILNSLLLFAWVALLTRLGRIYFFGDDAPSMIATEALHGRPVALPTPTSISGPQALRPIVGKCFYFLDTGGARKYEFCAYRSVRMILMSNYQANVAGHWKEWKTETGADGKVKFISQKYINGETCPGFGPRECEVVFKVSCHSSSFISPGLSLTLTLLRQCDPQATAMKMLRGGEIDVCKYRLILASKLWCEVDSTPVDLTTLPAW